MGRRVKRKPILLQSNGEVMTVYKWAAIIAESRQGVDKTVRGRLYKVAASGGGVAYGRKFEVVGAQKGYTACKTFTPKLPFSFNTLNSGAQKGNTFGL